MPRPSPAGCARSSRRSPPTGACAPARSAPPTRTTTIPTRTRSEVAVLAVERAAIVELRRGTRIAPRILGRGPGAVRAAFVPTQAGPLAGDRDVARIVVGAGATLVVEPVAATLALPGDATTELRLDITVREGGRLVLDEGPLIVAAGATVRRRCTIELATGAVAAVTETVVLGRDGEPSGAIDSVVRATLAGRPLLHDGLRISAAAPHVALPPGHRVVGTIAVLGARPVPIAGELVLDGPGALRRATARSLAEVHAALAAARARWPADVCAAPHASAPALPAPA